MKKGFVIVILLLLLSLFGLQGCKETTPVDEGLGADPTQEEIAAEESQSEEQPLEAEAAGEEAGQEDENKIGGTLVYAINMEPDTLDPHKTYSGASNTVLANIGASLVWLDENGEYIPYLAESWSASDDGLSWMFNLRQDVYFHNGTPLTAHDYAWTFNRAVDPETASPVAGTLLGDVNSIEAVDDYTLQINLNTPNFSLLFGLSSIGYVQPLSQQYFEEVGADEFANNPVGVGPFKFKEWHIGENIILERNPDFNWGPACFESSGPINIETLEYRVLTEYSTTLAGLEAGELDYSELETRDLKRLLETDEFFSFASPVQGINPFVLMNVEQTPFDAANIRKAFNLAIDRESIIQIVYQEGASIQYGPISESVAGYWEGVKKIGYDYDPETALSLLQDDGYELNSDGFLEKDGQLLELELKVDQEDSWIKIAQLVQEQLKKVGVKITIVQMDINTLMGVCASGEYRLAIFGYGYGEADLLYYIFHSSMIGALNLSRVSNPDLDLLLEQSRTEIDPETRQEVVNQIQQIVVEEAYVLPLITPMASSVLNNRVQGANLNLKTGFLELFDAYIVEK